MAAAEGEAMAAEVGALTVEAAMVAASTVEAATVEAATVEASTVDIAREFTSLIVYQRGFEANSKVITTVDQISQTTINLIH